MAVTEHAVVIAGGGPTGLMLAGELALAGVDVASSSGARARSSPARARAACTRGRSRCSTSAGSPTASSPRARRSQVAGFSMIPLDISDFPTRHNYGLGLWQNHIERILAEWVGELPVTVYRGRAVTGFAQDDGGVDVELSDGERCGRGTSSGATAGAASSARRPASLPGLGSDDEHADRRGRDGRASPSSAPAGTSAGIHGIGRSTTRSATADRLRRRGPVRVMLTEQDVARTASRRCATCSEALVAVYGTDFGDAQPDLDLAVHRHDAAGGDLPRAARAAGRRRRARALPRPAARASTSACRTRSTSAGSSPWSSQGAAPDSLLDTYHAERHPVGARVLRTTMAATALHAPRDRIEALREIVAELLGIDEPRKRVRGA